MNEIADRLANDPKFDEVIGEIIRTTLEEAHITDSMITSPAIRTLCIRTVDQLPNIEADLRRRFAKEDEGPNAFLAESVLAVVELAWDYGFRAGRLFHAQGNDIPL